jgi:ribosomal protein L7/L12
MRVAVSVSKTARNIASQLAGEPVGSGAVAVPEDVVALARAGKSLEAVKRYREVSGATLDEAQAVIRDIN